MPDDKPKRFQKRGPGRPKGAVNNTRRSYEAIRQEFAETWGEAGCKKMLFALAKNDFPQFLKYFIAFAPKALEITAEIMSTNIQIKSETSVKFRQFLLDRCEGAEPTVEDTLAALDVFQPTDSGNGREHTSQDDQQAP